MEDFDLVNKRVKDSINACLVDTSDDTISDFGLKFFKSICKDCVRRDCVIRHSLYDADKIANCKYFMPVTTKALESTLVPDTNAVGGTIFYIDYTADGEYQFFDVDGSLIENVHIGDRPYAYKVVSPGSKDKYYVYHDELFNNLTWAYYKNNTWVYEPLGTNKYIGSGKTNTETVMTKDNGAYIVADSNGYPTIWYKLQQVRDAKVGGCDDWFVPSHREIEVLMEAINLGTITGGMLVGSECAESLLLTRYIWSSSESHVQFSWFWHYYNHRWDYGGKQARLSVIFTRAF